MKTIIFYGGILFLFPAGNLCGAVMYRVTDLSTLTPSAINNNGQIVGSAYTASGDAHAFIYDHGSMQDLGTLPGGTNSVGVSINDNGQVVGNAVTGAKASHAFLYSGGNMTDLGKFGDAQAQSDGLGINDSGNVAGGAEYTNLAALHPFFYSGGVMHDLGTLGPSTGDGGSTAINEKNQVVGAATASDGNDHAFLWENGTMLDLGAPPGANTSTALALNNNGQVVGKSNDIVGEGFNRSASPLHAFLYSGGVMQDLGTLPTPFNGSSIASGINDSGWVVGYSQTSGLMDGHAFLYTSGTLMDLNSLIPASAGWELQYANGINDAGYIVGTGINPSGQSDGFLLSPVPEPTTLLLASFAVLGLTVFVRCRRSRAAR